MLVLVNSLSAHASIVLPEPVYPNVEEYDDFYSYSLAILNKLYPDEDYTISGAGSGNIALTLWSGIDNDNSKWGENFSDSFNEPANDPNVTGSWSASVIDILEYLDNYFDGATVPFFVYDFNQLQNANRDELYVSAIMTITDSTKNPGDEG